MSNETVPPDLIPEGRTLVGNAPFRFACHPGVACFTDCCRKLELYLYPFDVLRLKQALGITSSRFMHLYTRLAPGSHPFFPAVMLNMADNEDHTCPFLTTQGCSVYGDRPSSCRTYPLERAVEKKEGRQRLVAHYFMTHHSYCHGHGETCEYTLRRWERDQGLYEYNLMNDLWAEVDAFFATNPWQGEGAAGPMQQLAFMVCYNIDEFRNYAQQHRLADTFRLKKEQRRRLDRDDEELLKFGFSWLLHVLGNRGSLRSR